MAIVKKGLVKFWLKILSVLIGFFSFKACGPGVMLYGVPIYGAIVEYGAPYADYSVTGNIKASDTKQAIQGIRVQFKIDSSRVATSDAAGNYQIELQNNFYSKLVLEFTDIDGASNGSFVTRDVTADFSAATFTGGNGGWYKGKAEITVNVELDKVP